MTGSERIKVSINKNKKIRKRKEKRNIGTHLERNPIHQTYPSLPDFVLTKFQLCVTCYLKRIYSTMW